LVLAALADSPSVIRRPLRARDTSLMAAALNSLGASVSDGPDGSWLVTPGTLRGDVDIDCGLAGTVMRFVPPVAALANGVVRFDGDPRARVRPMGGVIDALRALDVSVDDQGRGTLPFTLQGNGSVDGGEVTLDASASSQFVSALLLAAPRFDKGLTVRHRGAPVPSLPHIEMTVAMLRDRGVVVDVNDNDSSNASWTVHPGPIAGLDEAVEPDLSNAAPFLAAAMIAGGTITIPGWPSATTQPGDDLRVLLTSMGARTTLDEAGLHLEGPGRDGILGLDADLRDVGELTPSIAALCVLASTPSRLTGIAHLRGHETDRLAALVKEINQIGGAATELPDGIAIEPAGDLHGGVWSSYDDHRMATAGAIIGLAVSGIEVEDIATTAKTLPDFVNMWSATLGQQTA